MAPRALWKGYLKLSLVSCAVALFTASSASDRIRFNMINRQTGNRLKQQYVDSATGDLVEPEDRARGYEVAKNEYILIEDEELNEIEVESTHTITVDKFVPRAQMDEIYFEDAYYIAPDDRVALEAFSVIRDAMRDTGTVGLARVVLHRRERIVMLEPRERGILAVTLHYPYEIRSADAVFGDIQPVSLERDVLDLAKTIIRSKEGKFDPAEFEDRYENALVDLVKSKQAGRPVTHAPRPEPPSNVVNLMDALQRSLAAEGGSRVKSKGRKEEAPAEPAPAPKSQGKNTDKGRARKRMKKAG